MFPRRQVNDRLRHKPEDLRERRILLCTRAMGKGVCVTRRKTAAAVFGTAVAFLFIGGSVLQQEKSIVLTKAEKQLIEVIRSLDYGEVRVMIKDNKPIRVEEIRRSIQLPNEK